MRRTRIYLAAAMSTGSLGTNVARACEVGLELLRLGYAPMVPHLSAFLDGDGSMRVSPGGVPWQTWIDADMAWVEVADAVLRLPGESKGADAEEAHAVANGIPVYGSVAELVASVEACR